MAKKGSKAEKLYFLRFLGHPVVFCFLDKMRFPTVDKFFGCGQLKTGVLAIGSLHLVGFFLFKIGSSFSRLILFSYIDSSF